MKRWTMMRRLDHPHDHGSLVARGGPVPEPDEQLDVFDVVALRDVRDVIGAAAAVCAGTGHPGDLLISVAMFQVLGVLDEAWS